MLIENFKYEVLLELSKIFKFFTRRNVSYLEGFRENILVVDSLLIRLAF